MIRVQRPRTDQKTTAEKRQTVVCVEFDEFVECLLKSAPIHERANMHGGCRVEIEEEVRSSNSKDEPGDKRPRFRCNDLTLPDRNVLVVYSVNVN